MSTGVRLALAARVAAVVTIAATALPIGIGAAAAAPPSSGRDGHTVRAAAGHSSGPHTAHRASSRRASDPIEMRVLDITPSTPVRSTTPKPLTISLQLRNTTSKTLSGIRIEARRGEPIANQRALNAALADPTPPSDGGLDVGSAKRPAITLEPGAQITTTFRTTTSIIDDGSGLCLCDNVIYPLYLSAAGGADDSTGVASVLGTVATYVPSLFEKVDPVKVAWVWPLIDRPHRLTSDSVFVDDALARSITDNGRLDRALQVVEDVDPSVPMTLVVDPELLDELAVMATGRYTVRGPGAPRATAGTGQQAAEQWLDDFQDVLRERTNVQVTLTPYADPDVQALSRNSLSWASAMPSAMERRVSAVLAGRAVSSSIAVPPGGAISKSTLNRLAANGATTLLLDSTYVTPRLTDGVPSSLARLRTPSGSVAAALTSTAVQSQVRKALEGTGESTDGGAAALPLLTAEIAVRAIQNDKSPGQSGLGPHVVLTPPRHVDVTDPDVATRMIEETSSSAFSTTVSLSNYAADRPDSAATLRTPPQKYEVPVGILRQAGEATSQLPALSSLLGRSTGAKQLLTTLPEAVQRVSSAAWRPNTYPFGPAVGGPLAAVLSARVDSIVTGVRIVPPTSGSYTLGSDNSDLPITIDNRLPYTVMVQISVRAKNGLPGFEEKTRSTRIGPNSKQLVRMPAVVQRSGRIPVEARLTTTSGADLGTPVSLFVQSTVFGVVGLVITIGAGGVLVLALVLRYAKRVRRIRARAAGAPPRASVPGTVR